MLIQVEMRDGFDMPGDDAFIVHIDDLEQSNADDPEVTDAVHELRGGADHVHVGGGAAPLYVFRRMP